MSEQIEKKEENIVREQIKAERKSLVERLENWMETPLLILGFVWLILLVTKLTGNLSPALELLGTAIWVILILDFTLKFILAPDKIDYLKINWLTAQSKIKRQN